MATKSKQATTKEPSQGERYCVLSVQDIKPSSTNPRKFFDDVKIQELADSIAKVGLLSPVIVRRLPDTGTKRGYFELVVGERRFRATIRAGLDKIACEIRDLTDQQVLEIQCIENDQRSDVTPMERARAYQNLIDSGLSQVELAARLGRSAATVGEYLALHRAPELLLEYLEDGLVSRTVVAMICRLPQPEARLAATRLVLDGDEYSKPETVPHPDWEPLTEATPLTVDGTKRLIERHFSKLLTGAPFSLTDAKLLPEAGSCKKCPKRAGTDPEKFPHSHRDTCFEPECYRRKCNLQKSREEEEAIREGCQILAEQQLSPIISTWGDCLVINPQWEDFEAVCEYDPEGRKWGEFCNLHRDKITVYFGHDAKGRPRHLIKKDLVRILLEGLKLLPKTKAPKVEPEPEPEAPVAKKKNGAGTAEPPLVEKLTPKARTCPKCGSGLLSGLVSSFWAQLNEHDEIEQDWAALEGSTSLSEKRMCGNCEHEFS